MQKTTQNRVLAIFAAIFITLIMVQAHASEGEGEKKTPAGPMYVDFKNIVVPVIQKNGSTGVLALTMMAEVADEKDQHEVTDYMPKLRDAFIRVLYGNLESNRFVRDDGALDIDQIKNKLMHSAEYVMKTKENPIKDILFQNIAEQAY